MDQFDHPESYNKVCKWPCGTYCWIEDLDDYLLFMSDDYQVVFVPNYDLSVIGLM